jgi:hypothetical protein
MLIILLINQQIKYMFSVVTGGIRDSALVQRFSFLV